MLYIKFLLASLILINTNANTDWKLRKDDMGVRIYTRSVAGSPFEEFRAVVTIPKTTITNVLDVITDVKNYPINFPNCSSAAVLLQKDRYDDIHYIIIDTPWPVKKRDAIYEASTSISPDRKHAQVKLVPRSDYKEERAEFIRVHNGSGFWELDEVTTNTIQVVYQFHADPGGEIPAWIANAVIVSNPLKTMQSLRDKTKKLQN
ncbi:MAG TPA: START domain-containing protein [Prolixibacteraceae bacterium]